MAFWLRIRSRVMKPAERRIIVSRSKCVWLMNAMMPRLSVAKDSSTMTSSYCLVSKLRPEIRATRSSSLPRPNSDVNATRSMSV